MELLIENIRQSVTNLAKENTTREELKKTLNDLEQDMSQRIGINTFVFQKYFEKNFEKIFTKFP